MKKLPVFFLMLVALSLPMFAEGAQEPKAEKVTLNIYNAAGYESFYKAIVKPAFEKAHSDMEVNFISTKWTELGSKLKTEKEAGFMEKDETTIHLVITGPTPLLAWVEDDLIQKIWPEFKAELPNAEKIIDSVKEQMEVWGGYGIGTQCDYYPLILRNPHKVPLEFTDLWSLSRWIKQNPGKFQYGTASRSGAADIFVETVAVALGEDIEHPETWVKTWDYLGEISPYIKEYPTSTSATFKALAAGAVDAVPLGIGWQAELKDAGTIPMDTAVDFKWSPVQFAFAHIMGIPVGVPEDSCKAALKFINFELSDEMQAKNADVVHLPVTLAGWDAMTEERKTYLTQLIGFTFPEFLRAFKIVAPPTPKAYSKMWELWAEKIGAVHEYKP